MRNSSRRSNSPTPETSHVTKPISLLQNLGFIINWEKSVINPTRQVEYLGFHIDSSSMTMSLTLRTLKYHQNQCQNLLRKGQTSAKQLAKIIGKILLPPLQYRHLHYLKTQALFQDHQGYESMIQITPECKAELQWWIQSAPQWNGRSVKIHSENSRILDSSTEEQRLHISALEIKAVMFAVEDMSQVNVHLRVDNAIHQQDGRDQIYGRDKHLESPLELMFQQTDRTHNGVPPRDSESDSRCPVSELPRFKQLETEQIHFPGNNQNPGPSGDQSVHGQNQY